MEINWVKMGVLMAPLQQAGGKASWFSLYQSAKLAKKRVLAWGYKQRRSCGQTAKVNAQFKGYDLDLLKLMLPQNFINR